MLKPLKLFLCIVFIIMLQVSLLPASLEDPFKPNLLIIFICYLALRGGNSVAGAAVAYLSGLLNGSFSGFYFGLSGISFLFIYLILNKVSDQLYTESIPLITTAVFIATLVDALTTLLLVALFSSESAIYLTVLSNMVPNAIMTALITWLFFSAEQLVKKRFAF